MNEETKPGEPTQEAVMPSEVLKPIEPNDDTPIITPVTAAETAGLDDTGLEPMPPVAAASVKPASPIVVSNANGDNEAERQIRVMSRRSFVWGAVALGAAYTGWHWLTSRPQIDGVPWPLRRALETNEEFARDYFQGSRLAPTFPRAMSEKEPRTNGDLGLSDELDADAWKLHLIGLADMSNAVTPESTDDSKPAEPAVMVTLADIKKLPKVEMTTEFKCIEGWSMIVNWGGARLSDFLEKYPPATISGDAPDVKKKPQDLMQYVYMETPDAQYYVGLDMASALHPQTLLCYEMNGEPLSDDHGAPLRLVIPVKYGVKNIKRIGTIRFTKDRPADYWAEQGYNWYAGH